MKRFLTIILFLTTMAAVAAEYPLRTTMSLNHDWQFYFAEDGPSKAEYVTLPHTWNDGEHKNLLTTAHYKRTFAVPSTMRGKRLFVRFGGVQSVASVFLNGRYVGEHKGAYTEFVYEITDKVRYGESNTLLVVVSNTHRSDVLPVSSDQDIYGGIYRDVELVVANRNIVSPTFYGSDGVFVEQREVTTERASGVVKVHLSAMDEGAHMVNMRIIAPDGYEVCRYSVKSGKADKPLPVELPFSIDYPDLWSPDSPTLYRVEASIGSEDKPSDVVVTSVGFRSISVNDDNRLCINGKAIEVRGVNMAHDRQGVGVALRTEHIDSDFAMIRNMGANALRSLSGPHMEYLYDRCDKEGMMVWVDLPMTCSVTGFNGLYYYPTEAFKQNGIEQLYEIVYQNYNHPSILLWGVYSLVTGRGDDVVPYVRELNDLVHTIDPSRKSVACSNRDGELNFITDLIVLRQDVGWTKGSYDDVAVWCGQLTGNKKFSKLRYGVCYGEEGVREHTTDELSRTEVGAKYLPERNQTIMHECYMAHISENPIFWGVWLDNMFDHSSMVNANGVRQSGVVAFDHQTTKDAYHLYRALWNSSVPTLYIAERGWQRRCDELQRIKVYSSVGCPTLVVGEDTYPMREYAPKCWCADSVRLGGETMVRAYDSSGEHTDSVLLTIDKLRVRR